MAAESADERSMSSETAVRQRDFERLLNQERVAPQASAPPKEGQLEASRAEVESWITKQADNEEAGTFDWELGRQILLAKKQFSADSVASDLHNPEWCRDRRCPAKVCIAARNPVSGTSRAGMSGGPGVAHQVSAEAVWGAHEDRPSSAWRRWLGR